MKKFVSILLVLVLMMSLSVAAFASEGDTEFTKKYVVSGGTGATAPAETFEFENLTCVSVTDGPVGATIADAPTITFGKAVFANDISATSEAKFTVTVSNVKNIGVYTYTFNEKNNGTAGITYYPTQLKLVVTVTRDENDVLSATYALYADGKDKTDEVTNTYAANSLTVNKKVAGNLGDKTKEFTARVTFTSTNKVNSTITGAAEIAPGAWTKDETTGILTASANITIKHGSPVTFNNIPAGVNYSVAEIVGADGKVDGKYVVSYDNNKEGVITADAAASTTITNTYDNDSIDMGVSMDSLPYILMLVVVGAAVVVIATRKKGEQF